MSVILFSCLKATMQVLLFSNVCSRWLATSMRNGECCGKGRAVGHFSGHGAADWITRLSLCAVSCFIRQTLSAFGMHNITVLIGASDVRLCVVQGPGVSFTRSNARIARGNLWGEVEGLQLFCIHSCWLLQTSSLPCTAFWPGCPQKVGCTQNYSLVYRSWTPVLPIADMIRETNL